MESSVAAGGSSLRLADDVALPISTVTSRLGIFGVSGSGKTYTSAVLAEELHKIGAPLVILDPMGAAWGLTLPAAGEGSNSSIYILGGERADLPLDPASGAAIADLVAEERLSLILDLSAFDDGDQRAKFAGDFARQLFERNRKPVHVVVDEADLFAPQAPSTTAEFAARKALDNLVRRGRYRGVGVTVVSQRPAVVDKSLLAQITTLIVHQLTGQLDQNAIDGWTKRAGGEARRKEVLDSLADLDQGEAWVWRPGKGGIFARTQIRKRETFDSSKTPEFGETIELAPPRRLGADEIKALANRLQSNVEAAAENDPEALCARIAALEAQLRERPLAPPPARIEVEVPVLDAETLDKAIKMSRELMSTAATFINFAMPMIQGLRRWDNGELPCLPLTPSAPTAISALDNRALEPAPKPLVPPKSAPVSKSHQNGLTGPQQAILDTLAVFRAVGVLQPNRSHVAVWSGASPKSSSFTNNLSVLRTRGCLSYPNGSTAELTDAGIERAQPGSAIKSRRDLLRAWQSRLNGPQGRILEYLWERRGQSFLRKDVAVATGASPTSSSFTNNLSGLRSLGLVDYPDGATVTITGLLFPEGLPD